MRLLEWVVMALVVIATLSSGLLVDNPNTSRYSAVYLIAILCVCVAVFRLWRGNGVGLKRVNCVALAFTVWCCLSLLWASDWKEGALRATNVIAMYAVFIGVQHFTLRRIGYVISFCVLGALALFYSMESVYWGGFGNENFLTEYFLIALPWTLFAGWLGIAAFLGSAHWLLFVSNSDSTWAALAAYAGLAVLWMLYKRRWFVASLLVLIPSNIALYAGWATRHETLRAIFARLEMTYNTGAMWLSKPIGGWGIGSFNYVYPRFQEKHLAVFPFADTTLRPMTVFAGAAHNEYVQGLAEIGLVGVALAAAVVFMLRGKPKMEQWAAWSALASAGALCLVGFPLHNTATALLVVTSLGVLARR